MKIIKVDTKLNKTIHEYPEENSNEELNKLLGSELFERVLPTRLYSEFCMCPSLDDTKHEGESVVMLVDEDGLLKNLKGNLLGSWLYATDVHKHHIVGDILFVGQRCGENGPDFCGIDEDCFKELDDEITKFIDIVHLIYGTKESEE